MPKLFIAGKLDKLVPLSMVKEVFTRAVEPKQYYEHPLATHDYKRHPRVLNEINNKTLEFFKNHL